MTWAWLLYCVLVSVLLGVSARVAEAAARDRGCPGRWPWAVALAGSLGLPLVAWLRSGTSEAASISPVPMPGAYLVESFPPLTLHQVGVGPSSSVDAWLLWGWAGVSVILLFHLAVAGLRVRAEGQRWTRREVDGVVVMVSERTGPAALGLIRGRVVLPEWTLSLDRRLRRLLVLHEAEHVRARDPLLAVAGLVACALVPWNPALWWQHRRMRLAIEVDCDARVLRRSADAAGYGTLLLEVGQRRSRLALGLAESRSMLERRIRMITAPEVRGRGVRALGLGAVSVLVLAVACEMPPPVGVADDEPPTPGALETLAAARAMTCEPGVVIDGARMAGSEALDALDPADIASIDLFLPADAPDAGACGLVLVLTADAAPGVAELTRMLRDAFGVAADRQAGDEPAPQEARTRSTRLENPGPPQTRSGTDRVEDGPTFTPMTVRPTLTNVDEVRRAFDQHYPPLLRGAGITGTAQVWLFIDADGVVRQTRLRQSAGHDALDQAALRVARTMVFTPARYQGAPVAVWIALPVRFASKATGPRSTGTR